MVIARNKLMPELEKVSGEFWGKVDFVAAKLALLKPIQHRQQQDRLVGGGATGLVYSQIGKFFGVIG